MLSFLYISPLALRFAYTVARQLQLEALGGNMVMLAPCSLLPVSLL